MSLSAKLCPFPFTRAQRPTRPNCDSMPQELRHYRDSLKTYITSTYHVSNPALVEVRAELLERDTAIAQEPYVESTVRYKGAQRFRAPLLPPGVSELMDKLGEEGLVFDPPYDRQAQSLELALAHPYRDLVVTTGTGSGKMEAFLLPIRMAKAGGMLRGLLDALVSSVSLGCRAEPLSANVERLALARFEPAGWTDSERGYAHSVVDYVARWLGLHFPGEGFQLYRNSLEIKDFSAAPLLLPTRFPTLESYWIGAPFYSRHSTGRFAVPQAPRPCRIRLGGALASESP